MDVSLDLARELSFGRPFLRSVVREIHAPRVARAATSGAPDRTRRESERTDPGQPPADRERHAAVEPR